MRRVGITVFAFAAATGLFLACVGDDPSSSGGPAAGAEGGPCFPNQTCSGTLTCTKSNVCVDLNADGGADGTTNMDAPSGDAFDAFAPDTAEAATPDDCGVPIPPDDGNRVRCAGSLMCLGDASASTCCRGADAGLMCGSPGGCAPGTEIACSSPCAGGGRCCAALTLVNGTAMSCPASGTMTSSACKPSTEPCADTTATQLCNPNTLCPGGKKCRAVELALPQGTYVIGACL